MKTIPLLFVLGLAAFNLRADTAAAEASTVPVTSLPTTAPLPKPAAGSSVNPHTAPYMGPQSGLTPAENKILAQARIELQKDPELVELNNQIKALNEKRTKLT